MIEINVVVEKSKIGSYGVGIVGHYQDHLGRSDYEIAQPLGLCEQDYADMLAVYIALLSIKPKFRNDVAKISANISPLLLKGESGYASSSDDKTIRARSLLEKFVHLEVVSASDLSSVKARSLATKAANNITIKGKIDEFRYCE